MVNADDQPDGLVRLVHELSFNLGPLEVQPATLSVTCGSSTERLEPRVMQVLIALVQAGDRVVSRDELVVRCWDGRIVSDNAVHRVIGKLRELSAGFASGAFIIETVPRVGYRLVVTNELSSAPDVAPDVALPAATEALGGFRQPRTLDRRQALLGSLGTVAVAAGLTGVWAARRDPAEDQVKYLLAQSDNALRLASPDANEQGAGFLEEAVALMPRNANAWGRLALVRCIMAEYASPDQIGSVVAGTQSAAQRALALDEHQSDALAALALLPPYFGDWRAAEERMLSVLDIDSGHLPTLDAYSFLLGSAGRAREGALKRLSFAHRELLHAGMQFRLIYAYWILGRLREADRSADRALQLWPKHAAVWSARLWTLAFTGRADMALVQVQDVAGRPDLPPGYFAPLEAAMRALASGSAREASLAVDALMAQVSQHPSASINAIMIFNALGELDRAFEVAEAYLLRQGPIIANVNWRPGQASVNDQRRRKTNMLFVPVSAPMRKDPRFEGLMQETGLTAYWDQAKVVPDHLS